MVEARPSLRVFYRLWKGRAHHWNRLIARSYRWLATIRATVAALLERAHPTTE